MAGGNKMIKYLVLGKNGQLGKAFEQYLHNNKQDFIAWGRKDVDVSNFLKIEKKISLINPQIIINCIAYNKVDDSEADNKEAFLINEKAVENLAKISKKINAKLVHYSTDYVFDGEKQDGYAEEDQTNPLNEYGKSKLAGEIALQNVLQDNYLIFRVSWLYGDGVQNFPKKVLEWAKNQETLQIADDEISCPTDTKFIVEKTIKALKNNKKGLFHLTKNNPMSRYEWAIEILLDNKIKIKPVSQKIFNLPAKRGNFLYLKTKLF